MEKKNWKKQAEWQQGGEALMDWYTMNHNGYSTESLRG